MDYIKQLTERYPILIDCVPDIISACDRIANTFCTNHGKLLVAGNGGSAADAEHIVGELMKGFINKRPIPQIVQSTLIDLDGERGAYITERLQQALPAIALTNHNALSTAFLNDIAGDLIFAQQVYGYGRKGDVFLGISTSGNAKNVVYAMLTAKALGIQNIALTGGAGGEIARIADTAIIVREFETYKIQELHLPIYHAICLTLEEWFFGADHHLSIDTMRC